ncbi:Cyclin, Nterminal domain containing protein [Balamuthia mandrillaris]
MLTLPRKNSTVNNENMAANTRSKRSVADLNAEGLPSLGAASKRLRATKTTFAPTEDKENALPPQGKAFVSAAASKLAYNNTRPIKKSGLSVSTTAKSTLRDVTNASSPRPKAAAKRGLSTLSTSTSSSLASAAVPSGRVILKATRTASAPKPTTSTTTKVAVAVSSGSKANEKQAGVAMKDSVLDLLDSSYSDEEEPVDDEDETAQNEDADEADDDDDTDAGATEKPAVKGFLGGNIQEIEDIDAPDRDDPCQCAEYAQDIFETLMEKEARPESRPLPDYMKYQTQLSSRMRGILVDWMVDVAFQFDFTSETMFLSVQLMDKFLSLKRVSREKMQLVGLTTLMLAAKFEELQVPYLKDFIWVSADAYTHNDILLMEKIILRKLDFNLTVPTPLSFLRRFSKAARSDTHVHTLSKYLTEVSVCEYKMIRFRPSCIAAAAVYIARKMSRRTPTWNKTLEHYTRWSTQNQEFRECILALNAVLHEPQEAKHLHAVRKKYARSALLSVSRVPPVDIQFE